MPPCLNCGSSDVTRSRRWGAFESIALPLLLHRPFRCRSCGQRFYGFFFVSWLASVDRTLERLRLSKMWVVLGSLLLVVAVGYLDIKTGYELSFAIFYLVPIALASWLGGRAAGIFTSFACAGTWLYADLATGHPYSKLFFPIWNACVRLGFFLVVASLLSTRKRIEEEREALISELQMAHAGPKSQGTGVAICGACKRIREGDGDWKEIETYLRGHSEADVTLGICPECERKLARKA
jgi:hypothetical protein